MDAASLAVCLRALGDPNRLAIFELLRRGQHCNCNMGDKLGLAPNLVSHHLKVLRECGLVVAERHPTDARWVLYSLNRDAVAVLAESIAALLTVTEAAHDCRCEAPLCPGRRVVAAAATVEE